jgi:hypothetical protein
VRVAKEFLDGEVAKHDSWESLLCGDESITTYFDEQKKEAKILAI